MKIRKQIKNENKKENKFKLFFITMLKTMLIFALIILLLGLAYAYILPKFIKEEYLPNPFKTPEKTINLLVLGQDVASGNTDVIILANINPKENKIVAISIPRDTRVKYGRGYHKINSMYAAGGSDLIKEKVTEITGERIDYFMLANTQGFRNIIDILDGVEVQVSERMKYTDREQGLYIDFSVGTHVLDGKKAEEFVRYRQYLNGDIDRISNQHIFFNALIDQKLKPEYLLKADKILAEIFNNVTTDLNLATIINYASMGINLSKDNIHFLTLAGEPQNISGISYYIYDTLKIETQIKEYIINNPNLLNEPSLENNNNNNLQELQ